MSLNNCVIVFDQNEHGTYFTGQIVTGKVIITMNKSKKLKGIQLQVCGYASCEWKEKHGRQIPKHTSKQRKRHMYYGREDYIASTTYLVGSELGQNFEIDAGTHTFTFACPIPPNCPSSFEGTFGHVRYMAKVIFIKTGSSNRTHNVGFTVLKLLDLNQESGLLKSPANNEAMENFCLLYTQAVHIKVDLMQTGYVPGQFILVSTHVQNNSSIDCKSLMILLNLRARYTSDTPCMHTTSEKITLAKKFCGPVPRHTQKDFADTLRVPATPPTSIHLSKVVGVSYELCVIAVMNHLMRNPKAVIPITIGNVPLTCAPPLELPTPAAAPTQASTRCEDAPMTSARAMQLATAAPEENDHDLLTAAQDDEEDVEGELQMDMPPPTYEEAIHMTANIVDEDVNAVSEVARFTPRYPVYDVDSMMAAQTPAPNKPQKRRRRKKKKPAPVLDEKPPMESPVQI